MCGEAELPWSADGRWGMVEYAELKAGSVFVGDNSVGTNGDGLVVSGGPNVSVFQNWSFLFVLRSEEIKTMLCN